MWPLCTTFCGTLDETILDEFDSVITFLMFS